MRVWILFSHFTRMSSISSVLITASRKYVIRPISAVFHLFATFVNVVPPLLIRIWRTWLSNAFISSSLTRRYASAVCSFVLSFCSGHVPSRACTCSSRGMRTFGRMRTSKPHMSNSRFGLSREYTHTNDRSHSTVVSDRGRRLFMFQNTARPRFTSCFISRMRASRGQHFLLL